MTNTNDNTVTSNTGGGRLKLLALWMIPIGLMLAAILVYKLVMAGQLTLGSKNEGILLSPPLQFGTLAFTDSTAAPIADAMRGKWSMVVRGGANCDDDCRRALYLTRQVHIRLDKSANRVQRIYLSDQFPLSGELQQHIEQDHRYLHVLFTDTDGLAAIDAAVAATESTSDGSDTASFFLVDPQGWAMMVYQQQHQGGQILKDLKHLLKYSRET